MRTALTFGTRMSGDPKQVRPIVEEALKAEGFGVITEIDVQATLKSKLGLDTEPYLILGACNPGLAHRAIEIDPSIGALLPCNVVLRADDGGTIVEAMDPVAAMSLVAAPGIAAVAQEARTRLARALSSLKQSRRAPAPPAAGVRPGR